MAKTASKSLSLSNSSESHHFSRFDVFSKRPPQIFQVQAKISTIRPAFPDYLSISYDYGSSKFREIYWKRPVYESLFNKAAGLGTATQLKRDSNTGVFLWILRNYFLKNICCFEVVFIKMISCGTDKSFNIRSLFFRSLFLIESEMSSLSIFSSNSYCKRWKYCNKLIIFNIHGFYKILWSYQLLILIHINFCWACKVFFLKCFADTYHHIKIKQLQ